MGDHVEVRKYKWPDRWIDRGAESVLGEDRFGRWHGLPAGRPIEGADGAIWRVHGHAVILYPTGAWWCAVFTQGSGLRITKKIDGAIELDWTTHPREVYINICQPLHEREGHLAWLDLDIDVIRNPDGSVVVVDEDEFEAMGYPEDVARRARVAAREIVSKLRNRVEPFGEEGARWLERFTAGEFD